MLQECSYWASRKGAVQIFFLTPNRNMSAGKFAKSERLLAVLREDIIFNVKWVEVRKIVEWNCIVKCVIFFASFCWLWDFLLENLKLRKKVWWCQLERLVMSIGTSGQIKKRCMSEVILSKTKKKIWNMRFWIIYTLVQFSFLGVCFRAF